ncbi:hypothetical protein [Pseudomonas aeruginosa]|uniref:hypothetical protein n=1 Tax=Pseudomonas aeruginosa TaxID=287 RepID=UPI001BC96B5A|nr:hypothetical protein [Pseudomonas aeruginosa]
MSSTQHQLIEQCAIRLRGIVEALDNIHDSTQHRSPHRWSTDLDDVHSSAESLLALIKDRAPTQAAQGLAGAALAQPSPKCATCGGTGMVDDGEITCSEGGIPYENGPVKCVKDCPDCKAQPSPAQAEQAEAERPEMSPERAAYFMRRFKSEEKLLGPNEQAAVDYVLSLLAQHDRIVGELRDELEAERKRVNIYVNNNRIRQDNERLRAELRDALARVAGLELGIARIAGDFLPDNSGQAELALDEMRQALHELLAAAPTQAQHSVPDGAADLCRFLAKLYCELDGLRYSTAKLPAEQIADALIFKWPVLQGARNQLNIKRISEQPYDESKLHSAIAAMLAAAPGNSVPQAWLDVQAERRRQITAESWTPEHDDEHADGQMAQAAGCYALHAGGIGTDWPDGRQNGAALFWPWDKDSWKPTTPRRDLVKACALALAEIERLDRAGISQSPQPGATTASS